MAATEYEYVALPTADDPRWATEFEAEFSSFERLYEGAFARHEREPSRGWVQAEAALQSRVVLALEPAREGPRTVAGGIVVQYFEGSQCGLLAYLVVHPKNRCQGVGAQLVEEGILALGEMASEHGGSLAAVFGETQDFRKEAVRELGPMPAARMHAHSSYGALWVEIDYTMPRFEEGGERDSDLLLLAFPHPSYTLAAATVPVDVVKGFLGEYYEDDLSYPSPPRGAESSREDLDRMLDELDELAVAYHQTYGEGEAMGASAPVPLSAVPLPADPVYKLESVAVCLHFVTVDAPLVGEPTDPATASEPWLGAENLLEAHYKAPDLLGRVGRTRLPSSSPSYRCPVYHSFETDLLAYRFQEDRHRPIMSACMAETRFAVTIRFPERVRYVSEGLVQEVVMDRTEVEVVAALTASRFPKTGVRVWHLALAPPHDGYLTELDIIQLVSLYYNDHEQTSPLGSPSEIQFKRTGTTGEWVSLGSLLHELSDTALEAERPAAGTIELNPAVGSDSFEEWKRILSALYLTTQDDQEAFRELEALYEGEGEEKGEGEEMLDALCGVVSGLFDYRRMSFAEMQDTLAPDSAAGSYAIWLSRATLTNVDLLDEMLDRCGGTIGISPYLILPHAVLLHNEFVVDRAVEVARMALTTDDAVGDTRHLGASELVRLEGGQARAAVVSRIDGLVAARQEVEKCLHLEYVPNVFNYPGERELYEVGAVSRGAKEKQQEAERLYEEVSARIRDYRDVLAEVDRLEMEGEEKRRSFLLTVVSVILSLGVLPDLVVFFSDPSARRPLLQPSVWTLLAVALVVVGVAALLLAWPGLGSARAQRPSRTSKETKGVAAEPPRRGEFPRRPSAFANGESPAPAS